MKRLLFNLFYGKRLFLWVILWKLMDTNMQDEEFWEGGSPIASDVSQTSQGVGLELKGFLYTLESQ